jgi:hypothetical protein
MASIDRRGVLVSAGATALVPKFAEAQAAAPEAFIGPLPGWKNARADFGAVGDGRADDTAALQRALSSLVATGSTALFLPAGRYRITRTLVLPRMGARQAQGLNIQGDDPARTVIVWDGPRDGRMFEYGGWYSKLGRITFDGAGKAGIALAHGTEFVTANEIADCVFQDVGVGIEAGTPEHAGVAETAAIRCRFMRCTRAGASLRNFNSLDWWFRQCRFEDCQVGITNLYGAGNFHAYDSVFLRSRDADLSIRNTGYLSFRNNHSIGSKAFFVAQAVGAGAEVTLQGNRIVDTLDVAAVKVGNLGPLILLDNVFLSRAGQAGPVVEARSAIAVAVGNRHTAADLLAAKAGSTVLDNARMTRPPGAERIPAPALAPPRHPGPVSAITIGTSTAAIQAAIDAASRRGGGVIHFAPGSHAIDRTLVLPAGADIRLVGDGIPSVTRLDWSGAGTGPVVRMTAPSRAQIHNLAIGGGGKADGIELAGVDAAGGAVLFDQTKVQGCTETGYQAERLARTRLVLRDIDHGGNRVGMKIVGTGAGRANAPVTILSGSSSDNDLSYEIADGGRLLARDIWYESGSKPGFMRLTGDAEFVLNGSNIATPRRTETPAVLVQGLRGRALFLGVIFTGAPESLPAIVAGGGDGRQNLLLLGCQGHGEFFADRGPAGQAARVNGLTYTAGGGARSLPDRGRVESEYLRSMLALARTQEPRGLGPPRHYRV